MNSLFSLSPDTAASAPSPFSISLLHYGVPPVCLLVSGLLLVLCTSKTKHPPPPTPSNLPLPLVPDSAIQVLQATGPTGYSNVHSSFTLISAVSLTGTYALKHHPLLLPPPPPQYTHLGENNGLHLTIFPPLHTHTHTYTHTQRYTCTHRGTHTHHPTPPHTQTKQVFWILALPFHLGEKS